MYGVTLQLSITTCLHLLPISQKDILLEFPSSYLSSYLLERCAHDDVKLDFLRRHGRIAEAARLCNELATRPVGGGGGRVSIDERIVRLNQAVAYAGEGRGCNPFSR